MKNTKNIIKKIIAWFFLITACLLDVIIVIVTIIPQVFSLRIALIAAIPSLIIKTSAILLGHFRHNSWWHDYEKNKIARKKTIQIMIIVDAIIVAISGLASGYIAAYHNELLDGDDISIVVTSEHDEYNNVSSYRYETKAKSHNVTYSYETIVWEMLIVAIICGILTTPAIILSLIISSRKLKNTQNKTNNREDSLFSPVAIKINSVNNSTKAIIAKKIIAWFFLIASLLVDIVTAFIGIVPWIGYGMMTLMIVGFCAIPFSIIKVLAILMGYYRHDDWQYDYKKITSYKMRTALLIIIVDIVSIVIAGIISNFGVKWCGSGGCGLVYDKGLEIVKEVALAIGFSSIPALFASLVIGAINKKK